MAPSLFDPLKLRDQTFANRVWVSPMCQYSAVEGMPQAWHEVHLGQFAIGGAGLVMTEATAVSPEGRISPEDTGIWSDEQAATWRRITDFLHEQNTPAGIQLAHAGRKASTYAPWRGHNSIPETEGGWEALAPSALAFGDYAVPSEMTLDDIAKLRDDFVAATLRALYAGFDVVELHAAHGYLLHEFLSPISNQRTDEYGGSFENRTRLILEVVDAVRAVWPEERPLFVRISSTDWVEGGWTLDDSVALAQIFSERGVDLVDASSGGLSPLQEIPVGPDYQVFAAEAIKAKCDLATAAVGMITEAQQAEDIVAGDKADAVFLARAILNDPHWPHHAAAELGVDVSWPDQYARAKPAS